MCWARKARTASYHTTMFFGLRTPLILVGKDQQFRRHLVVLQCLEEVEALTDGAAVVALTMDDQRRCPPMLDMPDRRVAIEVRRIGVRVFTAHLDIPPGGMVGHARELRHGEDTGVRDQAAKTVGL